MSTLIIVPCGQGKIWDKQPGLGSAPAKIAYTGASFKVNRTYAEHFSDYWLILSAKYGFVSPDFLIPGPYNVTFKKRSTNPVVVSVLQDQIKSQRLDRYDTIIGLGGIEYRNMIEQAFAGYKVRICFPFAGLALGLGMQATLRAVESNVSGINDNGLDPQETLCIKVLGIEKPFDYERSRNETRPGDLPDIEVIWDRIISHQQEIFRQIRGGEFTYVVKGKAVFPDRTNVQISKSHFKQALEHYPLTSTAKIQNLRGPSYIYTILMDRRIFC